jgi:vitellogenic carboxypeptidase-like protein
MKLQFLLFLCIFLIQIQAFLYLNNTKLGSASAFNDSPILIHSSVDNVTIPGVSSPVYSGYLNVNKTNSNSSLFYIFYACPTSNISNLTNFTGYPIIIWLNGGPGSSSLLGAFYENGPFELKWNSTSNKIYESKRAVTWNENYHMMFVDQPIGTGGSYAQSAAELTTNQSQIAQHFYNALQEFYNLPNFTIFKNTPLFIMGESYAGKYVPCIADKILTENDKGGKINIPLTGISIGDGFTDPMTVMAEVGMFAYNLGLIDYNERITIEQNILKGLLLAKEGDWQGVTDTFNNNVFGNLQNFTANVNVYNIQYYGDYDTSALDSFLQDNDTSKRYNLKVNYSQQSNAVYNALGVDFMQPYTYVVESILNKAKLPILIYNGQDDLIVTSPGTMSWVEKLNWPFAANFTATNFDLWTDLSQNVIGYKKRVGNLELRIVNKAGHLVPKDTPNSAIDMATDFIERCRNETKH